MVKSGDRGFDGLVARTYDAALDVDAWPAVIAELQHETGSAAGGLLHNCHTTQRGRPHFVRGIAPRFIDAYLERFRRRIPWVGDPAFFRPGEVRTDRTINRYFKNDNAFRSTEYYNDWMRPQGFGHIMRSVLRDDGDGQVSLFLFRETDRGGFGTDETTMFRRLVPHLMRASEIRRRFEQAELRSARQERAVDNMSLGVVQLDRRGRLQSANRFADSLLRRSDGLICRAGRVVPAEAADLERFEAALRRALAARETDTGAASEKFSLTRRNGGAPLAVTLVPVARESAVFGDSTASAILLISDPETRVATSRDMLIAVYGLTPSEARLAALLTEGGGLRQSAEAAGITYETARSYLKTIFHKTGTRRQADLVRLLLATGS